MLPLIKYEVSIFNSSKVIAKNRVVYRKTKVMDKGP